MNDFLLSLVYITIKIWVAAVFVYFMWPSAFTAISYPTAISVTCIIVIVNSIMSIGDSN